VTIQKRRRSRAGSTGGHLGFRTARKAGDLFMTIRPPISPAAGSARLVASSGSNSGGREQPGKPGGALMLLSAGAALTYFIFTAAQGEPSAHLSYPLWPYYFCAGIFTIGALLYGRARRWPLIRWETRRALKQRVAKAEMRAIVAENALADARGTAIWRHLPRVIRPS
jgi:hypothetical protein